MGDHISMYLPPTLGSLARRGPRALRHRQERRSGARVGWLPFHAQVLVGVYLLWQLKVVVLVVERFIGVGVIQYQGLLPAVDDEEDVARVAEE